ncbi:MAG: helix-turn-helix transcriptional regulator [Acidimicrobiia bacterium]|nr:helix-turn-helix transcriptional regulator [Acidimicrobiia bacterium]
MSSVDIARAPPTSTDCGSATPVADERELFPDVGQFIRAQREIARMSVRRLADLAGVSNPYLSQIERGLRRPSAEILQQLAKALQISAETLYVRAGLLADESPSLSRVRDAIAADPVLTSDQKQALLNVYDSFVGGGARS